MHKAYLNLRESQYFSVLNTSVSYPDRKQVVHRHESSEPSLTKWLKRESVGGTRESGGACKSSATVELG